MAQASGSGREQTTQPTRAGKPVTIRDVARVAGVSQSTVSRALNASGYVSDRTRRKVLETARALGFRPNFLARSLKRKATRTLGLVIPDITNPFFPAIVRGVEDTAVRAGYSVVLTNTDNEPERERNALAQLREKWVDGLIVVPQADAAPHLRALAAAGVPLVVIDRIPAGLDVDAVRSDNLRGAYLAVRHLLALGHRRIAHIRGPESSSTGRERQQGYRQALEEAGVPCDPALVVDGDFRFKGGLRAASLLLDRRSRPTAIFAANDLMAMGALHAAAAAGIAVPAELAVVGFDDIMPAALVSPPLTTVAQATYRLGARAAELLIDRLEGRWSGPGRQVILEPELVIRSSCGSREAGPRA